MIPCLTGAMTPGLTTVAMSVSICSNGLSETDQAASAVTSGLPVPSNHRTVQCTSVATGAHTGLPNTGCTGFLPVPSVGRVGGPMLQVPTASAENSTHTIGRIMIEF